MALLSSHFRMPLLVTIGYRNSPRLLSVMAPETPITLDWDLNKLPGLK